jgi:hypothetical protein
MAGHRPSPPSALPGRAGDRVRDGDAPAPAARAGWPGSAASAGRALHDERGRFLGRTDLYYPAQRLGLEYDGTTHRDSLVEDNRRQNRLQAAGYHLLRFTAADINRTPDAVVALVARQLL